MSSKKTNVQTFRAEALHRQLAVLMEVMTSIQAKNIRQSSLRLTRQEGVVVNFLGKGPATMSELASKLGCAMSALTPIADRLLAHQIAYRERSEDDRRVVRVALTKSGQKLFQEHLNNHLKLSQFLLSPLSDKEQDALIHLLEKVTLSFKKESK
jgi:DNA-binding MarR family transcriptional regulator